MGDFFKSHDYGVTIYKHIKLPVYKSGQFNFFRCVNFKDEFYGKTVSALHKGNLRESENGRYSKLFPKQKISYWAESPETARAEIKHHGSTCDILTFWSYDDFTSTIPIFDNREQITIIDGRECGVQDIIDKVDSGKSINLVEENQLKLIMNEKPDCLVYDSRARKGGENYIFFEKGFMKLALREVRLRLGSHNGKNQQRIILSQTSDYLPIIENYGCMFLPIARVDYDRNYSNTKEYRELESEYYNNFHLLQK